MPSLTGRGRETPQELLLSLLCSHVKVYLQVAVASFKSYGILELLDSPLLLFFFFFSLVARQPQIKLYPAAQAASPRVQYLSSSLLYFFLIKLFFIKV